MAAMVSPALVACGSDEGERGLQPDHETAVPESDAADAMTESERRKRMVDDLQHEEVDEFDHAESDDDSG